MTLKDIAQEVGVSVSTVSRVLNQPNSAAASPKVREQIWEVARKSNYIPNSTARDLRLSVPRSMPLRPLYTLLACSPEEVRDDPFFLQIASSIEREAFRNGFAMQCSYSILDFPRALSFTGKLQRSQSDLIILGRFDPELLPTARKHFQNISYIGLNTLPVDCDQILCDGFHAFIDAVRFFHERGHHRIAFIGAEPENRYRGYQEGLRLCGLPVRDELLIQVDALSMDNGRGGMEQLLSRTRDVTAVLCANDMIAIGALRACRENGIRVPEDLSIMGCNDIPNLAYVDPQIGSIHVPMEEMGRVAVRLLLDRINGTLVSPLKVYLPYSITERASMGSVPLKCTKDG